MTALEIVFGIVLLVFSLAIIIVVLLQEGSQKNVGVVTGAFLSRWTKVIAIGFFVFVLVVNIVMYFVG